MQEELRRYSAKLVADGVNPLQCRVGVNTGEMVVRSIATGKAHTEYTPIGHTTNLAARMQAVAPVGSIAVAESSRKLCEGYFVLKSLGPTRVKGVAEPVKRVRGDGAGAAGVADRYALGNPVSSAAPQSLQNLDDGGFSAPHREQRAASAVPHWRQNFLPGGFSDRQFAHNMLGGLPTLWRLYHGGRGIGYAFPGGTGAFDVTVSLFDFDRFRYNIGYYELRN